jgi:hypothetical protein
VVTRNISEPLCRSDVIFITALVLVCALAAFIGVPVPLRNYAHDTFFFLDNAYRIIQGQVPGRDFSSAWGPVIYLIEAAGLLLSGMRPAGMGYANALFGALIAVWAFFIARTRGSPVSACAAGIYTILLIAAPFPIGNQPLDFGYAMLYNRYGYALFGIVMMECAPHRRPGRAGGRQGCYGAISTGIAVGLLAFLKISYAMVAMPLVGVLAICSGTDIDGLRRRILGLCIGLLAPTAIVMCYLRFDVTDMVRDLAMAAISRRQSLEPIRSVSIFDLAQCVVICVFVGSMYQFGSDTTDDRPERFRWAVFALLTIVAGYLLYISNQQMNTFPLNGYAAVVLTGASAGKAVKWRRFPRAYLRELLLAFCFLPLCLESSVSLAGAALIRPQKTDTNTLKSPERGAGLAFGIVAGPITSETAGADYVVALNDGLALLRRRSGPRDGVLTFDEFNPFNYLLDRPSPRGGFAATAYNYVFSDAAYPTAERFFGDAGYVMVRKYAKGGPDNVESGDVAALMRLYGSALRSHFTVIEETGHWVLWHRTGDRTAG